MFYALVANRSPFVKGNYKLPEGAGFGLKLDESVIARHRV
jgi:L-alanine-DL-glutamate epimerase-like enolase superfamily enzyme